LYTLQITTTHNKSSQSVCCVFTSCCLITAGGFTASVFTANQILSFRLTGLSSWPSLYNLGTVSIEGTAFSGFSVACLFVAEDMCLLRFCLAMAVQKTLPPLLLHACSLLQTPVYHIYSTIPPFSPTVILLFFYICQDYRPFPEKQVS
jgi:hypothetical protein